METKQLQMCHEKHMKDQPQLLCGMLLQLSGPSKMLLVSWIHN